MDTKPDCKALASPIADIDASTRLNARSCYGDALRAVMKLDAKAQ